MQNEEEGGEGEERNVPAQPGMRKGAGSKGEGRELISPFPFIKVAQFLVKGEKWQRTANESLEIYLPYKGRLKLREQ